MSHTIKNKAKLLTHALRTAIAGGTFCFEAWDFGWMPDAHRSQWPFIAKLPADFDHSAGSTTKEFSQ